MKKIRVEKIIEKEIEWMGCPTCKKKVCQHEIPKTKLRTILRTAVSENQYYKLRGWGSNLIEEGQEITGEITEEKYINKEGQEKTSYTITLRKPINMVVEDIYKIVQYLTTDEFNQVIEELMPKIVKIEESKEINVDDIPF